MITEEEIESVKSLVELFLSIINESETSQQVALGAASRLFAFVCRDCNLSPDQFMLVCKSIAGSNIWEKQEVKNEKE